MIIYIRLLSGEKEDFVREIAIDDNKTFADLHNCIQEQLSFDASQMASFFTTDKEWNKEMEITLFDMADSDSPLLRVMSETLLSEFILDEGQRLLYIFDFFSERAFFMEVIQIVKGNLEKANCYRTEGEPPQQIMIGDLTGDIKKESMSMHEDEFDGSIDTLDFENLEDIDPENLSDFY